MAGTGSRGVSTLLTVMALVVVGVFLAWLYWRTQAVEPMTPEPREEVEETDGVGLEMLLRDPAGVVGQRGSLDSLPVVQRLGRSAFVVEMDAGRGYPVLMSGELLGRQLEVYGGDRVSAHGSFYVLTDSIRDAWVEQGHVDEGSREGVPMLGSFLLADSLDLH